MSDIYSDEFQISLFDEMSKTYGIVNSLSSFGFNYLWRKCCRDAARVEHGHSVCDLMAGMGEMGLIIDKKLSKLVCVDFSPEMTSKMKVSLGNLPYPVDVLRLNVFNSGLPDSAFDRVVCSFGLKTLSFDQRRKFVNEMARIVKRDGIISMMEFCIPANPILRFPWGIYVRYIVPVIGKLFAGNPDNYRMLYEYAKRYEADGKMDFLLSDSRFLVEKNVLHFGSAVNYVIKHK